MSREILFRAKTANTGKWVYGYYAVSSWYEDGTTIHMIIPLDSMVYPGSEVWYEIVDPKTVSQYTGLDDVDGNKIFEGDIIQSDSNIGDVKWNETHASFLMLMRSVTGALYYVAIDEAAAISSKVIGNIYDNPELMEREG